MNVVSLVRHVASTFFRQPGGSVAVKALPAFDGLRGYMAWWVVIGHALHLCGIDTPMSQLLLHGDIAVNVFVCLSGFVITHLILEQKEDYAAYITRRAFRIFPIYWLSLICAILLSSAYSATYLGDWVQFRENRLLREAATNAHFGAHLALHIPLLHGLVPDTWLPHSSASFLAPAWSLSLEWQFYIVAPLLVIGLARPNWSRLSTLVAITAVWFYFKKFSFLEWQYPAFLPLSLSYFMVGILSRIFLPMVSKAGPWALAFDVFMAVLGPNSLKVALPIWIVFLYAAGCQLLTEQNGSLTPNFLSSLVGLLTSNRPARFLGQFSYSTYLIHIPVFSIAGWIAMKISGEWTQAICVYSTIIASVLLVPISLLLYRHVEVPFIRMGSQIIKRRRDIASNALSTAAQKPS